MINLYLLNVCKYEKKTFLAEMNQITNEKSLERDEASYWAEYRRQFEQSMKLQAIEKIEKLHD